MSAILVQLGIDQTFFYELAIFAVLFGVLGPLYFKPFMKLLDARHKKTVEDREAAEKLMAQADAKFEDYKRRIAEERLAAKKDYEAILADAKREEAALLAKAREDAKKITHEAAESVAAQRENLKKQLEIDVEGMAHAISERLLSRKV